MHAVNQLDSRQNVLHYCGPKRLKPLDLPASIFAT